MRKSGSQKADLLRRVLTKARGEAPQLWLRAPVEVRTLVVFLAIWSVCIAVGLPPNLPDGNSLRFVERHYFRPLVVALFIQIIVGILAARGTSAGQKENRLCSCASCPSSSSRSSCISTSKPGCRS